MSEIARAMLVCCLCACGALATAAGQIDVQEFPSAAAEARYRALIDEFRCPKCLNTNLSGSDAPIARDLRVTVHRLITEEGYDDQQIRDFLQARYGDFVLYDPPFRPGTLALWLLPGGFVLIGVWVLYRVLRPRRPVELTSDDHARVREILQELDG